MSCHRLSSHPACPTIPLGPVLVMLLIVALQPARVSATDLQPVSLHCHETSPRLLALGDAYFDVDAQPDIRLERSAIRPASTATDQHSLISLLQTEAWNSGHGQRMECLGSASEIRERHTQSRLHAIRVRSVDTATSSSHGNREPRHTTDPITIDLRERDTDGRHDRPQSLTLPDSLTTLHDVSGSIIISGQSRRRQKTPTGSFLRETALSALHTDTALVLEQSVYVNGVLAEWSRWNLSTE